jgi:hypothetical protein
MPQGMPQSMPQAIPQGLPQSGPQGDIQTLQFKGVKGGFGKGGFGKGGMMAKGGFAKGGMMAKGGFAKGGFAKGGFAKGMAKGFAQQGMFLFLYYLLFHFDLRLITYIIKHFILTFELLLSG